MAVLGTLVCRGRGLYRTCTTWGVVRVVWLPSPVFPVHDSAAGLLPLALSLFLSLSHTSLRPPMPRPPPRPPLAQGAVLDEVAGLKAALALEREERIAEDDEIVQAVNDYTKVGGRGRGRGRGGGGGEGRGGRGRAVQGQGLLMGLVCRHLVPGAQLRRG